MKYREIYRLKEMLEQTKIQFVFRALKDGYKIMIYKKEKALCSAIEHKYSYGSDMDLLEIQGGLTEEEYKEKGNCLGNLTAEEVFKRFKYCYENDTDTYIESSELKCTTWKEYIAKAKTMEINKVLYIDLNQSEEIIVCIDGEELTLDKEKIKKFLKGMIKGE